MKLHDPINLYLKGFRVVNPLGEREITVHDLLTHRSGLAQNDAGSDVAPPKPLQQHVKEGYAQPNFGSYAGTLPRWGSKVGEKFTYSNFGLATLGYLVEVTNPEGLSFPTTFRSTSSIRWDDGERLPAVPRRGERPRRRSRALCDGIRGLRGADPADATDLHLLVPRNPPSDARRAHQATARACGRRRLSRHSHPRVRVG